MSVCMCVFIYAYLHVRMCVCSHACLFLGSESGLAYQWKKRRFQLHMNLLSYSKTNVRIPFPPGG